MVLAPDTTKSDPPAFRTYGYFGAASPRDPLHRAGRHAELSGDLVEAWPSGSRQSRRQKKHWPQAIVKGTTRSPTFRFFNSEPTLDNLAHVLIAKDVTAFLRMLLTHRKLLQSKAIALENDLRATLRNFGLKVGMVGTVKFETRIKELVDNPPSWPYWSSRCSLFGGCFVNRSASCLRPNSWMGELGWRSAHLDIA